MRNMHYVFKFNKNVIFKTIPFRLSHMLVVKVTRIRKKMYLMLLLLSSNRGGLRLS